MSEPDECEHLVKSGEINKKIGCQFNCEISNEIVEVDSLPARFRPSKAILPPILDVNIQHGEMSRFVTYKLDKKKILSIRGVRIHFQLSFYGKDLYHTKIKTHRPKGSIPFGEGSSMRYSQEKFAGYLLISRSNSLYSVRKEIEYGYELLSFQIFQCPDRPRMIDCTIFSDIEFIPKKLISLEPSYCSRTHKYSLCFFGKTAITSVKNNILIGKEDRLPYVMIRKVGKDLMELDAPAIFPPLCIFGLGIASFIH